MGEELDLLQTKIVLPSCPSNYSRLDNAAEYEVAKIQYQAAQAEKAKLYKRIYFDDRVVRSGKESTLVAVERLWFPRLHDTETLQNTFSAFVRTSIPRNRSLGLSPLRILGPTMQDKAHHISPAKNVTRLITKIPSRSYTGPI